MYIHVHIYRHTSQLRLSKVLRLCQGLVRPSGPRFSFVHKSVQEFFVCSGVVETLAAYPALGHGQLQTVVKAIIASRGPHDAVAADVPKTPGIKALESAPAIAAMAKLPKARRPDLPSLCAQLENLEADLGTFMSAAKASLKEQAAVTLVAAKIRSDVEVQQRLFGLVELSKLEDGPIAEAAAMAASLLSVARVPLTHRKWAGVRLRKAMLQNAICSGIDLTNSDLSSSCMQNCNLDGAQVEGCNLKHIDWGRFSPLRGHREVESVAVTPDGRYIVSGSRDETVRRWSL